VLHYFTTITFLASLSNSITIHAKFLFDEVKISMLIFKKIYIKKLLYLSSSLWSLFNLIFLFDICVCISEEKSH
jgi:hypothetical protein